MRIKLLIIVSIVAVFMTVFSDFVFADTQATGSAETTTPTPAPTNTPAPTSSATNTPVPTIIPTITVLPTTILTTIPTQVVSPTSVPVTATITPTPSDISITPTPTGSSSGNSGDSSSPSPTSVVQAASVKATPTPTPQPNPVASSISNLSNTLYSDVVKFPASFFSHPEQQQYYQSDSLSKKETFSLLLISAILFIVGLFLVLPDRYLVMLKVDVFLDQIKERLQTVKYSLTSLL